MAYPSHRDLTRAQYFLRRDDHRMRLRFSMEKPDVLIERQTFVGRIGRMLRLDAWNVQPYTPDAGRRREEGHVLIASVPTALFDKRQVQLELREADTWRQWDRTADPLWRRIEQQEERQDFERGVRRFMAAEHRASSLFDRYAWKTKSRVTVPAQLR